MARRLQDKTNVTAPGGNYPYGRVKNNSGANDGTPVDENLVGDEMQFWERLLAIGGVIANGLPENSANTFQYMIALINIIVAQATTLVNAEAAIRSSSDTTLQNNINSEASTRGSADTTLQNNINSEATARSNADALKANKAQGTWTAITFINGWTGTGEYRVNQFGKIEFRGTANGSASSSPVISSTIPAAGVNCNAACLIPAAGTFIGVLANTSGVLQIAFGSSTDTHDLSALSYYP